MMNKMSTNTTVTHINAVDGDGWGELFNFIKDDGFRKVGDFNRKLECLNYIMKRWQLSTKQKVLLIDVFDNLEKREDVIRIYKLLKSL